MKAIEELGISPWPWRTKSYQTIDEEWMVLKSETSQIGPPIASSLCEGNARLIAAAPEMAKVCYDLIRWDGNLDAKFLKIIDDAKAAYAKASGEEAKL